MGRPQPAPAGNQRFCRHCGIDVDAAMGSLTITAPGVDIEMTPGSTRSDIDTGELASGAGTAAGMMLGGPIGMIVGMLGGLFGGVSDRKSEEAGLPSPPRRSSALRTVTAIVLLGVLVVAVITTPLGRVFLSPLLGLFLLWFAYTAYRMRRR